MKTIKGHAMDKSGKIILVSGATGRQGGSAARHLLNAGWQVRILVRDPDKQAARDLSRQGAQAVRGDFDDRDSLREALKGCYGAFSVQNFYETGLEGEVRQGSNFADAAKEAGVEHFVYSSVGSAHQQTGIPHFETKWQIERYLRNLNLPATILRPVFFMDNFLRPDLADAIHNGTLELPMWPQTKLQMIAVEDIGGIAAAAFAKPEEFIGQAVDIAGDEMTMPEAASHFGRVLDRPVQFIELPLEEVERQSPEVATMFRWFNEHGYKANIESARDIYPALMDLDAWLRHVQFAQAKPAAVGR